MTQIYDIFRISYHLGKKICSYVKSEEFEKDADNYCNEQNEVLLQDNKRERYEYRRYFE